MPRPEGNSRRAGCLHAKRLRALLTLLSPSYRPSQKQSSSLPDEISDGVDDVVGVLTERIEDHFAMSMDQLKAAVVAAPAANPEATDLVRWHGLLVGAQSVLDRAEEYLLAALETQPSQVDDPTLDLAHRVNGAVNARDGRALVVRWLLDPGAPGKKDIAAERQARRRPRTGPAVQTTAPYRPAGVLAAAPAPRGRASR